jgi:hypothetical protein
MYTTKGEKPNNRKGKDKMTYRECEAKLRERMTKWGRENIISEVQKLIYQTVDELPCRNWDDEITERDIEFLCSKNHRYKIILNK